MISEQQSTFTSTLLTISQPPLQKHVSRRSRELFPAMSNFKYSPLVMPRWLQVTVSQTHSHSHAYVHHFTEATLHNPNISEETKDRSRQFLREYHHEEGAPELTEKQARGHLVSVAHLSCVTQAYSFEGYAS